jgi:hypothetical protein
VTFFVDVGREEGQAEELARDLGLVEEQASGDDEPTGRRRG